MEAGTAGGPAAAEGGEAQGHESGENEGGQEGDAFQSRLDEFRNSLTEDLDQRYTRADDDGGGEGEAVYFNPDTGGYEDAEGNPIQLPGTQQQGAEEEGQVDPELDPLNPDFDSGKYREAMKQDLMNEMRQELRGEIEPLAEHIHLEQLKALQTEFPQLGEQETAQAVVQEAQQFAAEMGAPEAWNRPNVLKTVYLARAASERAAGETPAGDAQDVELERTGGQPGPSEGDIGDAIVNAGQKDSFWMS